ncbi:MAG TPA: DEAD/DEAH box helicase [Nannocystaceae bacterium]|nr:DEAD/DEAH box helicase [Nannocystaceae bacterium]
MEDRILAQVFGAEVLRRGIDIWQRGAVHGLARDPGGRWQARVWGTAAQPYRVWALVDGRSADDIDGGCTCPAPSPCKHVAAVVYGVKHGHGDEGVASTPLVPRPRTPAIERWAEQLERIATTAAAREPAARKRELLFLLTIDAMAYGGPLPPRVIVEAYAVGVRKDGGRGRAQPYDLGTALQRFGASRPDWIDEHEYTLWFRLQSLMARAHAGQGLFGSRAMFPLDTASTELFHAFVATGRVRLSEGGPPLFVVPSRPGRIQWQLAEDGTQTLHVLPDDAPDQDWIVLPLVPLHFCDPASGACGPIAIGVPDAIAPWLVGAPQLPPEASTRLPRPLEQTLASWKLPMPQQLELAPTRRGTPTPVLRLRARKDGNRVSPYASLAFDYDGTTVDPEDPRASLVRVEGKQFARIDRDREAEMKLRARLRELGLAGAASAMTLASQDRWLALGREGVAELRAAGWRVAIDESFEFSTVDVDGWYARAQPGDDDSDAVSSWFLELGVVIGGERVNVLPAIVAAIRAGRISRERVRLDGGAVMLPLPDGRRIAIAPARLQAMLDVLVELGDERPLTGDTLQLEALDAARIDALGEIDWDIAPQLAKVLDRLRHGPRTQVEPPRGLHATLRDYQARGLDWLQWLHELQLGGILADDMGLGKTVQALADVLVEKLAGRLDRPALVIAPRSVLRNWQREAERFTPALRTAIYHGPGRASVLAQIAELDLVITTYALLQRDDALASTPWHLAILDEAQAIKNPAAKVSVAARKLDARHRLCMTGTPMENNLGDLWSLMSFANPGLLGTAKQFTTWYRTPIEKQGASERFGALLGRIAPFVLRRTKAAVLAELPPKTEVVLEAVLDGPERDLYESVRLTMEKRVREELAARGLARSQIVVLDALLKLRQVCCHAPLTKLKGASEIPRGAKLELLLELVGELVAEGRRALVFSQFTSMLDVIEQELDALGIRWLSITGATRQRQQIVDRFQAGEVPILLVSLKAGGTGLNLTAADTVIHYDPWWNPAVEAQATDRAHRIGQAQPVTVYRLICEGTVEERMLALQAKKAALLRGIQTGAEERAREGFALAQRDIDALLAPIDPGDGASEPAPTRGRRSRRA